MQHTHTSTKVQKKLPVKKKDVGAFGQVGISGTFKPISLDQQFSWAPSAPLQTQHYRQWEGGGGAGPPPLFSGTPPLPTGGPLGAVGGWV